MEQDLKVRDRKTVMAKARERAAALVRGRWLVERKEETKN
jgi:hypothetical protein